MSSSSIVRGWISPRDVGQVRGWRFVLGVIAVFVLACSGLVFAPVQARAASMGPGFSESGFIGAFVAESDGRQVYCMDWAASSPLGLYTSGPQTVTAISDYTGAALSRQSLAELNYVMGRWGGSGDPAVTMAVQMFVWAVADPTHYLAQGGDSVFAGQAPAFRRAKVLANLGLMRSEATVNAAVDPSASVKVSMRSQYAGTLTVGVSPAGLSGNVVLSNAQFVDGTTSKAVGSGSFEIVGTPPLGAASYQVSASASFSGAGLGARVDLYSTSGAQRLLAAGSTTTITAKDTSPVIPLDFQPVITTQVASRFVEEGDAFVDKLSVETVGVGPWIEIGGKPVGLTARGTLYGPFEAPPVESEFPPADAPAVGVEDLIVDRGVGEYTSPGTLKASSSGFYTWVWGIDKNAQGENAKYIRTSFTDWFGRVTETHVTPFRPVGLSLVSDRIVNPGQSVSDEVEVWSENGPWLMVDGSPVEVVFTGTAYRVSGTLPPVEGASIPEGAARIGSVDLLAAGPGVYISEAVVLPEAGFVTWVWEVLPGKQDPEVRNYIAAGWVDNYGIPRESTSVRHRVEITSEVREYNVHPGGRAFDEITVGGFPDNHGDFTGDGYWGADLDEVHHTVYGPVSAEEELTDDLDLADVPVLAEILTPARNGVYRIGYTDTDAIRPTKTGWYVVVSSFAGDDRVQPFMSSPGDVKERFYVPPSKTEPIRVVTNAQEEAWVGDPFTDTAIITGKVPLGATISFSAFGPYPALPGVGEEVEPFFVGEPIPVSGPGMVESQPVTVDRAGLVFWVETLKDADGEILAQGFLGAPGETTKVREYEFTVRTKAMPEVPFGEPATDTAIVAGSVPPGSGLFFEAYQQTGSAATCEAANLVFTTKDTPIVMERAGEYVSAPVTFSKPGKYFWVETVTDGEGKVLHRGECGAEGETTIVLPPPTTPPPGLAQTGADGWLWVLIIALSALTVGGVAIAVSRRNQAERQSPSSTGFEDESMV